MSEITYEQVVDRGEVEKRIFNLLLHHRDKLTLEDLFKLETILTVRGHDIDKIIRREYYRYG